MLSITLSTALLLTLAQAQETLVFADSNYHDYAELDGVGLAGMIAGYSVLTVAFLFSLGIMLYDQLSTHKDYNRKLEAAKGKLRDLGFDIQQVDNDFVSAKASD